MEDLDALVRLAAFRFLEEQMRLAPEDGALSRDILTRGFTHDGQRVPLMGPQGIFKPRLLREVPLSITTVAIVEGETRPYDDAFGPDGLLRYRYRGTNPAHQVVHAYQHHCAVCRLRRNELLEAAHIVPDADPLGVPSVPNGVCALHTSPRRVRS